MPDVHLLGTHLQFVCFLSLLKTWLSVGALLAEGLSGNVTWAEGKGNKPEHRLVFSLILAEY